MKNKKLIENALKLDVKYSSSQVLLKSINIFKVNKNNVIRKLAFLFVQVCLAIVTSNSINTISICKSSVTIINEVILALFAVVFTGYSFFQALIGKRMLLFMVENDSKTEYDMSYLQESNLYFVKMRLFIKMCGIKNRLKDA